MGDTKVTQEGVEVLGEPESSPKVTQEGVEVLGEPESSPKVTQEGVEVLADSVGSTAITQEAIAVLGNPPGTITITQEPIEVLGEFVDTVRDAHITQEAIEILGTKTGDPKVTQTALQVLGDPPSAGEQEPIDHFGSDIIPPVALGATLSTITSLTFTPTTKTKFLLLASCTAGITFTANPIDASQGVLGQSVLLVDGLTVAECDIGNLQTYYCLDTRIGVPYTVELKAKRLQTGNAFDGPTDLGHADAAYMARISAVGLDDWLRIEQGVEADLVGSETSGEKVLMQDIIEPTFGPSLVFTYAENQQDTILTKGTYKVAFSNSKIKDSELVNINVMAKTPYLDTFNYLATDPDWWSGVSAVDVVDFQNTSTTFKHTHSNLYLPTTNFRRLRTVIIPFSTNNWGVVQNKIDDGGTQLTGFTSDYINFNPRTYNDFTYLILGSCRTHAIQGAPLQTVFRYDGLGLDGTTANLVLDDAGIGFHGSGTTFGIQNTDILGIRTFDGFGLPARYPGYQGEQFFGFYYIGATQDRTDKMYFFSAPVYTGATPDPDSVYKTGDRNMLVIQFANAPDSISTDLTTTTNEVYNKRTLVEINLLDTVYRYCLQEDIYLMDGFTASQILDRVSSGLIDNASISDLVITGPEIVRQLSYGNTSTAEDLLNLDLGALEGVTTSTGSEYTTLNSFYKLYKQGVITQINVKNTLPDSYYGVVEVDSLNLTMFDDESVLLTNRSSLIGAGVKVRTYDIASGEIKTLANSRISAVTVSEKGELQIQASNPDTNILAVEYPIVTVHDLNDAYSAIGTSSRLADNPAATVPIFFGKARRLQVPNIDKDYGTTSTTPNYLDAFSDYAVGGAWLQNGLDFNYIKLDTAYVTLGLYRNWTGITDTIEFDDSTNILQYDKFSYHEDRVPTFRFHAYRIDTSTRSSVLYMPHTGTTTSVYDSISDNYPSLVPVEDILHVYQYTKGIDWVAGSDGFSQNVEWLTGPNANEPFASPLGTTTITMTKGSTRNGSDWIINNDGTTTKVFEHIYDLAGVSQHITVGTTYMIINFVEGTNYSIESSNALRPLEDVISWELLSTRLYGEWNFENNLLDSSAKGNDLTASGGQPYYYGYGAGLEFINSETVGEVYITGASQNSNTLEMGGAQAFWAYAEVGTNIDDALVGPIIRKGIYTGLTLSDGYEMGVVSERTIYPTGITSRYIPYAKFYDVGAGQNSVLYGLTTSSYNLADGAMHNIGMAFIHGGTDAATYLYVDDTLEVTESTDVTAFVTTGAGFTLGGTHPDGTIFEGRISKVEIDRDALSEPLPGSTYTITFSHKPDEFSLEWLYTVSASSNPIQLQNNTTPYVIAGDFKVNGCEINPVAVTSSFVSTTTTQLLWDASAHASGHVIRLNYPMVGNVPAALTGATTADASNAYMTIEGDTTAYFEHLGDFAIYGYSKWTGLPTKLNGDFLTKELVADTSASYMLGMSNGLAFGMVRGNATTAVVYSDEAITDGQFHFLMLERDGVTLNLYVDDTLVGTSRTAQSKTTDYAATPLLLGYTTVTGSSWSGDVLFAGSCDYAPGRGFAAMQTSSVQHGIKGVWTENPDPLESIGVRAITGVTETTGTVFHIPFIEGVGNTTSISRNLHRNPALAIRRVLADGTYGLGERVDAASFDIAAAELETVGLKVDFTTREVRPISDILKDLSILRGIQLKKDPAGKWLIEVDSIRATIAANFGINDGYYNNIISLDSYELLPVEERAKEVVLKYRYFPDAKGDPSYNAEVKRMVHGAGTQIIELENPYIIDHATADRVVDYVARKLRESTVTTTLKVGQEGRNLQVGNLISLTIPHLQIDSEVFKIAEIEYTITGATITADSYSAEIFNYMPGPFPPEEEIATGDDREG